MKMEPQNVPDIVRSEVLPVVTHGKDCSTYPILHAAQIDLG